MPITVSGSRNRVVHAVVKDLDLARHERGGTDLAVKGNCDGKRTGWQPRRSVIGPIELLMIRGPAAMTIGRYQMFSGSPTTAPLMMEL